MTMTLPADGGGEPADKGKFGSWAVFGSKLSAAALAANKQSLDNLVEISSARLASRPDQDVQIELAHLLNLLPRLSPQKLADSSYHLKLAFGSLSGDRPNVHFAKTIRVRIETELQRESYLLSRLLMRFAGRSPLIAALIGIVTTMVLSFYLFSALTYLAGVFNNPIPPSAQLLPLLVGAFLGAVISILTRLNHFSSAEVFDPFLIFLTATIKPFIAIIIATLIFAVLRTEVIYIAGINFNQVDKIPYVLWVIGFLAGFGERLIRDVVARNADIYDVETPGATKR